MTGLTLVDGFRGALRLPPPPPPSPLSLGPLPGELSIVAVRNSFLVALFQNPFDAFAFRGSLSLPDFPKMMLDPRTLTFNGDKVTFGGETIEW